MNKPLLKAACTLFEKYGFTKFTGDNALEIITFNDLKDLIRSEVIEDITKNGVRFEFLCNPGRIEIEKTARKKLSEQVKDLEDKIMELASERAFLEKIKAPFNHLDRRIGLLTIEMLLKTKQIFYEK